MLTKTQIDQFIDDGYARVDHAFSSDVAEEGRDILWKDTGCDPADPATWTQPVVRLGMYGQEPFPKAARSPLLHAAFDRLVGEGKWLPQNSLGTFPVRFPAAEEPNDTGWHVDASFPGENASDYFSWRINYRSRGRALLMLFLFSDVGEKDAPTRILAGSHHDVARTLQPHGEAGLSFTELAEKLDQTNRPEVQATGKAGTVYLCHPFVAHAAQAHHGTEPRFMAQPPLLLSGELELQRPDGKYSPVEQAIRLAVGMQ